MLHYLAFIWDHGAEGSEAANELTQRALRTSTRWQTATDEPGMRILYAGARSGAGTAANLANGSGVVLGTAFTRNKDDCDETVPLAASFNDRQTELIVKSGGRELTEAYWGSYVAFIRSPLQAKSWVLKSPMGSLPCYFSRFRNVTVYFSLIEDCLDLGAFQFSVNWNYVAVHATSQLMRSEETAIEGVTEIQAGTCVATHAQHTERLQYWTPFASAKMERLDDVENATRALKATTKTTVQAWASQVEGVLHTLSGGLDSSIILACLKDMPNRPRVTCVNEYYPTGYVRDDERNWARLAAQEAQCPLLELELSSDVDLSSMLRFNRVVRPVGGWVSHFLKDTLHGPVARDAGAEIVTSGALGDGLFHQGSALNGAGEYLAARGMDAGFLRVVLAAAEQDKISVWRVLGKAARDTIALKRNTPWIPEWMRRREGRGRRSLKPWVFDAFDNDPSRYLHPWFRDVAGVPIGKLKQLALFIQDDISYDPLAAHSNATNVAALATQPLVELSARIPTYTHVHNAWPRGLARRAFAKELPAPIRLRMSKGCPRAWGTDLLNRNRDFIRELLMNGLLAKNGILDTQQLEIALPGTLAKTPMYPVDVFEHLTTECWLQTWRNRATRATLAA